MIPYVVDDSEVRWYRSRWRQIVEEVGIARTALGAELGFASNIETPRSALLADRLALVSDIFSFGTNDLTELVWGLDRNSSELSVLQPYINRGVLDFNPFETPDEVGVGMLLRRAVRAGRKANRSLRVGISGELGGDPGSLALYSRWGVDYVSVSPSRVCRVGLESIRSAGTRRRNK